MRNFILFIIILFSASAKADYNSVLVSFTIDTVKGGKLNGYANLAHAYIDSLSSDYLQTRLDNAEVKGYLNYYKTKFIYKYSNFPDDQTNFYHLTEAAAIPLKNVKSITITSAINWGYGTWLQNDINKSDLAWMNERPVDKFSIDGYLCSYDLIIHKKSQKIDRIIKELRAFTDGYDGEPDDAYDEKVFSIIKKLLNQKAIVITNCTC